MRDYFNDLLPTLSIHSALIVIFISWLFRNYFRNKNKKLLLVQFIYLFITGLTAFILLIFDNNWDWLNFALTTPFALLVFWVLCLVVIIAGNIHRKETADTLKEILSSIMPLIAIGISYLMLIRLSGKIGG